MRIVFFIGIVLLLLAEQSRVTAQSIAWPSRGVGIATSRNSEYMNYSFSTTPNFKNMNVADDGQGGVVMCWTTNSELGNSICAQRVDGTGALVWTTASGGVIVATPTGGLNSYSQSMPSCMGDGSGGAYVTWLGQDYANGTYHPFIQHMSASGAPLWGTKGVSLAQPSDQGSTTYPYIPQMDKDGNGGVWVTWYSYPFNSANEMYGAVFVARLSGAGPTPSYSYGGAITIQTVSPAEHLNGACNPVLCTDNVGDAFVSYQTLATDRYYNHIAKINASSGDIDFNTVATQSAYPSFGYLGYNIAPDNKGGAILHYLQYYDSTSFYYMMMGVRVNNTGTVAWGPKLTHQASEFYQYPGGEIAPDADGGAYFLRYDNWNYYTPALQHIDSAGTLLWNPTDYPSGIGVATNVYNYIQNTQVISDPYGNAITAYANGNKIHVQKWDKNTGLPSHNWPATQLSFGNGTNPQLSSDGVGGAFVGWNQTTSGYDIYAQHVVDRDMVPQASLDSSGEIPFGNIRVGVSTPGKNTTIVNRIGKNSSMQLPLVVAAMISRRAICSTLSSSLPARIMVGDSMTLTILATPKKNGPFRDTVVWVTNDPFRPHLEMVIVGNGIFPHLTANDSVMMQPTRVNSGATLRFFSINNSGTDTLHVTDCTFEGNDKSSFTVIGHPSQTIPPGASGSITVGFAPTDATVKTATLNVVTDDSSSPKIVLVSGQGIYPHFLAPAAVQFPNTTVGTRTSVRGLVVTNSGTERLILKSATVSGTNAAEFSVVTALPDTILPGASHLYTLQFAPKQSMGSRTATLNIASNFDSTLQLYGTPTYSVNFFGMSVAHAPEPQLAQQISCGRIHQGRSDTVTVHILNGVNATQDFIIANYAIGGVAAQAYSLLDPPSTPDTLAPGVSRDVRIRFTAVAAGLLRASLEIASNATTTPLSVPILGTGIKGILHADEVDFGMVGANSCADTDMHVVNLGTDTLTITSLVLTGQRAGLFHTLGNTALILAPHEQATIRLRYCPFARQADSIIGRCMTGDNDSIAVLLHGHGVNSGTLVSQSSVDFGLVALQQNITRQLWITNPGDIPVTITRAYFANGTAPLPFSSDIHTPLTVAPGDSVAVTLQFKTNTGGMKTANLVLAGPTSAMTVALTGNATADAMIFTPRGLFDTTLVLGTAMVQSVQLTNFTRSSRKVQWLSISGPGAGSYTILYPLTWPYPLGGLSTDSILVAFRPFFPGMYLATLTIVLGPDSMSPTVNKTIYIPLSGRATFRDDVATALPLPSTIDLSQNFPNPFLNATQCTFVLTVRSSVTITLYDMLGRIVRELAHGEYASGMHGLSIDGHGLQPGMYSCVLRTAGIVRARLMQRVQ